MYKFIQSFQVGVVRHVQSDSKQQIRMNLGMKVIRMKVGMKLIRMKVGMKLLFCMWLYIHKYIYLIQSTHINVVTHTWVFQK